MPDWLVDFSRHFALYGGRMSMKELSINEFKERLNAVFRDMAESERAVFRKSFDMEAQARADVWDRAASLAMGLPSSVGSFGRAKEDEPS